MPKTKRVKIEVLPTHIKKGVCGDARKCMVALAVQKHIKKNYVVSVTGNIHIFPVNAGEADYNNQVVVHTTHKVKKAIQTFDTKKSSVKPFTFVANLPVEALK